MILKFLSKNFIEFSLELYSQVFKCKYGVRKKVNRLINNKSSDQSNKALYIAINKTELLDAPNFAKIKKLVSDNLSLSVILKIFLIFGNLSLGDSYKKDSYKKSVY